MDGDWMQKAGRRSRQPTIDKLSVIAGQDKMRAVACHLATDISLSDLPE